MIFNRKMGYPQTPLYFFSLYFFFTPSKGAFVFPARHGDTASWGLRRKNFSGRKRPPRRLRRPSTGIPRVGALSCALT